MIMKKYTVKQLAKLAGVSVRTLHHYDNIGLLIPAYRSESRYRLYSENELLRLQQILFFRELDFPLKQIIEILDNPDFEEIKALKNHRVLLQERVIRIRKLQNTIDKTINSLKEKEMNLVTDEELYAGFSEEQVDRYKQEVRKKYDGRIVRESEKRISKMTKEKWKEVKNEGEEVALEIAKLLDREPDDPEVQVLIGRHYRWICNFYVPSQEVYCGLGNLYIENKEFRDYYEKLKTGLSGFMRDAMIYYAENSLGK